MKHGASRKSQQKLWTRNSFTVLGAFLLSLLAFGLVFLLPEFTSAWKNRAPQPEEAVGINGKQRTVWVLFHDAGTLTGAVAVIGDTRTLTLQAIGFPAETEVAEETRLVTLQELFKERGEETASMLACQTAMDADGVVCLSVSAAASCVGRISGNLPYTLPETVGSLSAGNITLTPLQVADVLRYNAWSQGMSGRARIYAELTALFLEKALTKNMERSFGVLTDVCDSRLHISQFVAVQDDLVLLSKQPCTVSVAPGRTSGVENRQHYVLYY